MKVLAPYACAFPASTRIHRLCSSIRGIHKTFECTSSAHKLLNPMIVYVRLEGSRACVARDWHLLG